MNDIIRLVTDYPCEACKSCPVWRSMKEILDENTELRRQRERACEMLLDEAGVMKQHADYLTRAAKQTSP